MLRVLLTFSPTRSLLRAFGSLRLTTAETLLARKYIGVGDVEQTEYEEIERGGVDVTLGEVHDGGQDDETAPDPPPSNVLLEPWKSRRGRRFYQYWIARVYEKYPNVIHDHSPSALSCTRKWLCEEMRKPRKVGDRVKNGMHTWQIMACVDAIVALAHAGTNYRLRAQTILQESQPTWLERMFGIRRRGGGC